jgi:hypothetical protein
VQHIVHIQTSKLKVNENNSDLNLRGKLLSNCDETSASVSIELANLCPDSIHCLVLLCITLVLLNLVIINFTMFG